MKIWLNYACSLVFLVAFPGLISGQQMICGYSVPRLSPLPEAVTGLVTSQLSLNGVWGFKVEGTGKKHAITVPSEWEMQGFTVNDGETALYTRPLQIPADWKKQRVKLRFNGISSHALIKVNGIKVGEHEGSFVPFETDITAALKPSGNFLQVEVQAGTISDMLACTSQYAVHTVGGILRSVVLFALPRVNLASQVTTTVFDKAFKNATLAVSARVANESGTFSPSRIDYELIDADGKAVLKVSSADEKIPGGSNQLLETRIPVIQPRQWNPEHPYLYKLKSRLYLSGMLVQTNIQRLGFRQVEVAGNILLVNGKPVKLHGVNRHSVYPLTGRSISPELDRKDAELFRSANCNYIRTSHYPPSEDFLNAADDLGLFVESEASLCWIGHNAAPIWTKWNYKDEKFLPYMVTADIENVQAGRNHPSLIIWSLGNESRWSPLWEKVLKVVKALDPSRPTTFHDQCWGGYNNAHSTADIAVYHYPGTNGPAATDTMKRPVLFGEYAHISCYSRRELLADPGVRSSYGKPLEALYDSIYHHAGCLGGAIWAGIDDIFHMPDGRIIGYGPWGVIDAWRRPKPEYWGVKKAYAPVKITSIAWPSAGRPNIELQAENRYDFTSFSELKITALLDGIPVQVKSAILPHGSGKISIAAGTLSNSSGTTTIPSGITSDLSGIYSNPSGSIHTLKLVFTDPRGFASAEESFNSTDLQPEGSRESTSGPVQTLSVTENEAAYFISQESIRYIISKKTGIILSAKRGDVVLLKQGPVFCMVPMNDDDGGKPNVAGETYQNDIYPVKNYPLYTLYAGDFALQKTGRTIRLSMAVSYSGCTGKQSYTFTDDGKLITEYTVHYEKAELSPYQYGLMLQLPKSFDKLSWKRIGEFTSYNPADISRDEGTALLNAHAVNGVEAWGVVQRCDWKNDANALGSNDFRSTKRYIQHASLQNREGNSINLLSDGNQASRTWLQDEQLDWLVADYCNNGSEPYYSSPHSDGKIHLKDGATLSGKLIITLK